MSPCLDNIRNCLEGFVPAIMATVDADGMPNVAMISQVHYVDPRHVALSYQFFNKTRRNLLATGMAAVQVNDPTTCARYRLDLEYRETQTHGPLFEAMKAKLAGISSHSGMQGVFHLLGSDVFAVRSVTEIPGPTLTRAPSHPLMPALRRAVERLMRVSDLSALFDEAMEAISAEFKIDHAILLMLDPAEARLYTVAATGYAQSGIGSEIALGDGVIGVAAREGIPIRIGNMTSEYSYGDAVRESARRSGFALMQAREIPYPGLAAPESQLALPIRALGRTLGVLFVESAEPIRFCYDDEDALLLLATQLGAAIIALQAEEPPARVEPCACPPASMRPLKIQRYEVDNSIFLDHEYLIKGVAGAILWKLVGEYVTTGRQEFTNRELRLDPALRLPDHAENLEARLILLTRRLSERTDLIRLERTGRGRLRLDLCCTPELEAISVMERSVVA